MSTWICRSIFIPTRQKKYKGTRFGEGDLSFCVRFPFRSAFDCFFPSSLKTVATPSVFQNMELALSLGDTSKPFKFLDKTPKLSSKDLGFCMGLGSGFTASTRSHDKLGSHENNHQEDERRVSSDPPLQLVLLPFSPVPRRHQPPSKTRFPWLTDNCNATFFELILFFNSVAVFRILVLFIFLMCWVSWLGFEFSVVSEPGSTEGSGRGFDVNRLSMDDADEGAALSSPNSAASSFQMDFGIRSGRGNKRDLEAIEASRASDDEENGLTRKKLRLSKDQSAFLEESFKEHSTLNPVSYNLNKIKWFLDFISHQIPKLPSVY